MVQSVKRDKKDRVLSIRDLNISFLDKLWCCKCYTWCSSGFI